MVQPLLQSASKITSAPAAHRPASRIPLRIATSFAHPPSAYIRLTSRRSYVYLEGEYEAESRTLCGIRGILVVMMLDSEDSRGEEARRGGFRFACIACIGWIRGEQGDTMIRPPTAPLGYWLQACRLRVLSHSISLSQPLSTATFPHMCNIYELFVGRITQRTP